MYFTWTNFLIGLLGFSGGIAVTVNAYHINHQIWYFSWAEKNIGPGMGTIAYRWVGVAISVFSCFVMFGQINITGQSVALGGVSTTNSTSKTTNIPNSNTVQIAP